jgi:hypothetical protein
VIDEAGEQGADMTAVGVSPGVVTGNADDEPARELIVAAALDAAEEAGGAGTQQHGV